MIPVPVLVLASVIGLGAYLVVGSVVSALHMRVFEDSYKYEDGRWLCYRARETYGNKEWMPTADHRWAVMFWPFVVAGWVIAGSIKALVFGIRNASRPFGKINGYVAQIGDGK